jgi:hypothetical protein
MRYLEARWKKLDGVAHIESVVDLPDGCVNRRHVDIGVLRNLLDGEGVWSQAFTDRANAIIS